MKNSNVLKRDKKPADTFLLCGIAGFPLKYLITTKKVLRVLMQQELER